MRAEYERIREIGVLRAHGMHASEISRMFMLEGVITGFIGSILGLALGALLNVYLVTYGYPIDKIAGEAHTNELPFFGTAYGQWNPDAFIMMLVLGILIATIAAIIPARKAARLEVTEAMRFV